MQRLAPAMLVESEIRVADSCLNELLVLACCEKGGWDLVGATLAVLEMLNEESVSVAPIVQL